MTNSGTNNVNSLCTRAREIDIVPQTIPEIETEKRHIFVTLPGEQSTEQGQEKLRQRKEETKKKTKKVKEN